MTSQTVQQTNAIQISFNISRIKENQTTKLGQLIEYNMKNNFVEKLYKKYGGKTIPRRFSMK